MTDDAKQARKERFEAHIKTLQRMRVVMLNDNNWEILKPYIEAVTYGGMALQRILREEHSSDETDKLLDSAKLVANADSRWLECVEQIKSEIYPYIQDISLHPRLVS